MRIDVRKAALAVASVAVLIAIGIIIGININMKRVRPKLTAVYDKSWHMQQKDEGQMIYNNFWDFIDASYIIVGTPPDCQFYKIVTEIPRNDYDNEMFYIDYDDKMFYHDADGNRASTIAIDVSEFQPDINWAAVREAGVRVVMIRVGYRGYGSGKLVEDVKFREYVEGALGENLRVGVYFYTQGISMEEGIEEARFVLDIIKDYNITCPVAIDTEALYVDDALGENLRVGVYFYTQGISMEEGIEEARFVLDIIKDYNITCPVAIDTEALYVDDARTNGLDNTARTDVVVGFCDTVKEAGYTPMIYTNRNWLVQMLDVTRLGGYKIWYAHYTNQPDLPYEYTGWQYTDSGTLDGVSGSVDLNVWFE